ncbi:MAG: FIST C-terminal domain-containing protein [Treponema sp.]|jgi:hypothetical protein|nr:FIST C-terminal domain-containing protein [Treponema sp.]
MIRMLTAITEEIDEIDDAVSEILEQLHLDRDLLQNSVGLIACDYEFIESGIVEALCRRLPFDVAGITTVGGAVRGKCSSALLSLSVLTSNEVRFSGAVSEPMNEENFESVASAVYRGAMGDSRTKPSFILAFPPSMPPGWGASFLEQINKASAELFGGLIPVFGALSCDQSLSYAKSKTIWNGRDAPDIMALIFMYGDMEAEYFISTIAEKDISKQYGVITESKDNILKKVNDMVLVDYLETLGLPLSSVNVTATIPFVVNYRDGTRTAARALYGITPEGYAVCGGEMPVDATIAIGRVNYHNVIESAARMTEELRKTKTSGAILTYSCLTRNLMLGLNSDDEMREIISLLDNTMPYHIAYSGGEICPVKAGNGELINRFHNFTLIACVFR